MVGAERRVGRLSDWCPDVDGRELSAPRSAEPPGTRMDEREPVGKGVQNLVRVVAARATSLRTRKIAIIGLTESAGRVIRKLQDQHAASVSLPKVFDDRASRRPEGLHSMKVAGSVDDLIEYARSHSTDTIILALPSKATTRINEIVARLSSLPVDIIITDNSAGSRGEADRYTFIAGERFPILVERPISGFKAFLKKSFDIIFASVVLVICAPLLLFIALLIRIDSPGGALFRQRRMGFNNRPFTILKFRTMIADAADREGSFGTQYGDPRVTRVGRVLRHFSIDELPQFLNVLAGSMSVVGPRPQAVSMRIGDRRYVDAVARYIERHKVKPGLTGWAQVNGSRDGIYTLDTAAWAVSMDLEYIRKWSLWLDIKIIWKTIGMILCGRGAH